MFQTVFFQIRWLLIFTLIIGCSKEVERLPYYNTPDFTPMFLTHESEVNKKISHTISDFAFTDQNGQVVSAENINNKIHVANFIFTSCGLVCPIMTKNLHTVSNAFENDSNVVFLSYSVTPWIDTISRLKQYADEQNITNTDWHFLTGKKAEIYQLARQSYFAEEDLGFTKDSTEFLHTEHIILVDENRHIRGIYNGTLGLEIDQLIQDIQRLKNE